MKAMSAHILAVDDEENMRVLFTRALEREGYAVTCAASAAEAIQCLDTTWFDVVISDLRMAGQDGMDLLRHTQEKHPTVPFILLTGFGTIESAVAAMREGAWDYLTKPVDTDELILVVKKALDMHRLTREVERLRRQVASVRGFPHIIGQSRAMRAVLHQIKVVARSVSTVLIQGESGTGKELMARAIHQHSPRADELFVALDCGAVPESLLESELFGYQQGAFTGALRDKKGLFVEAHGGTLFLDEINNTSAAFQVKLLRVLQEREIRPVGSTKSRPVDVRLIVATSQDLAQMVQQGTFRSDVYYRLAVVPVRLPALRERREDIPLLVDHFIKKYCEREGIAPKRVAPADLQRLMAAPWEGNVRELENAIERAVVLSPGPALNLRAACPLLFGSSSLPRGSGFGECAVTVPLRQETQTAQETVERQRILEALRQAKNNRSAAAAVLGISRGTLYNNLRRYGLASAELQKS
jgi:DNA-binding NtrC family response regulator